MPATEPGRDVLEYASEMLGAFKPEALKSMGLDVLAEKIEAALKTPIPDYTYEHLEAGACMWEYVLGELRRRHSAPEWSEYRDAYGMCALREAVIRHAPVLEVAYQAALANGYCQPFDWEYVPKYMNDHITRILT